VGGRSRDRDHESQRGHEATVGQGVEGGDLVLGAPPEGIELDQDEVAALDALADGGLVPPLRLVIPITGPATHTA